MKNIYTALFTCLCISTTNIRAQNMFPSNGSVGIGTTAPDASSILELKSTAKGLLLPRMTKAQRNAIVSPANGLMIYQTNNTPGFYYYNGSSWIQLNTQAATYTAGQGISIVNGIISNLGDVNAGDDITINTPAGGDLVGNFSSPQVAKLQGVPLYPIAPLTGQILKYNGNYWIPSADSNTTYNAGNGLGLSGNVFTNTAPDQTVTLTGSGATKITGTYPNFTISTDSAITYSAGNGLNLLGNVFTNTAPDQTVTLTGGGATKVTGTYPNFAITTDSATTYSAGNGLNLSGNVFTNTAPDQTVTLTGSGATKITGTYPNFTISSTDNNTTYSAGNGLSLSGNVFTNTAPDKTVTIAGSGATTISGSYPNFTVNSVDRDAQNLSISGNRLSISNGNFVTLPQTVYNPGTGISISGNIITNTAPSKWDVNGAALSYNGNVGIGTPNPQYRLDVNGDINLVNALKVNGTTAFRMVSNVNSLFIGANAGTNNTGSNNIAIGSNSLLNGRSYYNTAVGGNALYSATSGFYNTATGGYALYSNTTGAWNTALGVEALYSNTTGPLNTALGFDALYANTSGNDNVAIGVLAFSNNTTGTENTGIGNYTNVNSGDYENTTAIGYSARGTASNQVRIGNGSVTSIGGIVNWTALSDGRVKRNIKENVPGLAFINKLKPVTYNLNLDEADRIIQCPAVSDKNVRLAQPSKNELDARNAKMKTVYTGFVAQDVEKVAKDLNYDFSGIDAPKNNKDLYGLRYSDFVVPLVKAVQELSKQNDDKEAEIKQLKTDYNTLQNEINELKAMLTGSTAPGNQLLTTISSISLQQNVPNPFNQTTAIHYSLPQAYTSAKIIITDKLGKTLKEMNVSGSGKGILKIDASTLASGAYQYSLYVNNKLIDTKQMLLQK